MSPLISAVVCTRNRSAHLSGCLQALARQTLPHQRYEVLIIDNGSTDDTAGVARAMCERHVSFRYRYEERAGLSVARNAGVAEARADLVAFTDDDAEPAADWLQRLASSFGPRIGVVGGEVTPIWETERPAWLSDALLRPLSAGLGWGPQARLLSENEWLVEVNIAYAKQALVRVGGFPESLGRVGDSLLSGEGGINTLVHRAGYGIWFDPAILVRHHIPKSRLTKSWFRRRAFWQGVTLSVLQRYIETASEALGLPDPAAHRRHWEELAVPASLSAWADLFEDCTDDRFNDQLYQIENIGHLLESQAAVIGR